LLGRRARLLHPKAGYEGNAGGGDFDFAVDRLDFSWPLRVSDVRVCQCIRHGPTGWYWVVEQRGSAIAIDALDDPLGIGPICFTTELAFANDGDHLNAVKGAFVTLKRLRKGIYADDKWAPAFELARRDPNTYLKALEICLGSLVGVEIGQSVLSAEVPDSSMLKRAQFAQRIRRVRTPKRVLVLIARSLTRLAERMLRPTGLIVAVAGPDGSGKSTLALKLLQDCQAYFWKSRHHHWRPGLLPRAGALVGTKERDTERPHDAAPHGAAISTALLLYYWVDFFLGSWLKLIPLRARSALIVVERGWWDIAVDPHRYRMHVSERLVAALGRLLPRPDISLVLEAPGRVLLGRKAELSVAEADRQIQSWHRIASRHQRHAFVDAAAEPSDVQARAVEVVVSFLERRTAARAGAGWVRLSRKGTVRWVVPRGPRFAAKSGLGLYQPVTLKGRTAWTAARTAASIGLFRLLPRNEAPYRLVRRALAPHIPGRGTIAVLNASHPNRFVGLIVSENGTPVCVAKLAFDDTGRLALDKEVAGLENLGPLLPPPLYVPRILHSEDGLVLLEPVSWRPRSKPWTVPLAAARAMGAFFAAGRTQDDEGPAHGDFAPWNLLEVKHGWVLVDWESSRELAPPYYDVFHYVVQSCVLLGRPSGSAIIEGLTRNRGPIAEIVRAYAHGAGIDPNGTHDRFLEYLDLRRAYLHSINSAESATSRQVLDDLLRQMGHEP
jgi:hypothetical protein